MASRDADDSLKGVAVVAAGFGLPRDTLSVVVSSLGYPAQVCSPGGTWCVAVRGRPGAGSPVISVGMCHDAGLGPGPRIAEAARTGHWKEPWS